MKSCTRLLERHPLGASDRGFVRETFFGILRHLTELDFYIGELRGAGALDAPTRAMLRLGLYQLFHLRTPAHAAVNETVALAGAARGLVNAILRRALREQARLEQALARAPREVAHLASGVPAAALGCAIRRRADRGALRLE